MMRMLGALLTLAMLGASSPCAGQVGDDVHELLAQAVAEYDAANYDEAYALFLRVHEAEPSARSERALGKTAFDLRRYAEAERWLESSLGDTRSPLTDDMRTEVAALLRRARTYVGHFALHASIAGASIDVDGAPIVGTSIALDVGEHEIRARADGYEPVTRRLIVQGGEDETIDLALIERASHDAAGTSARDRESGSRTDASRERTAAEAGPITLLVVGGAVAIAGAIMIGVGLSDIAAVQNAPPRADFASVRDAANTGPPLADAGWVALGVGVACALGGLVWTVVAPNDQARAELHVGFASLSLALTGSFP